MTTWFPHQHRTANDGITFEGEATGGGGGSGGVQTVTVPVSSAQILDLANTDVTLIAGVAGNVTVVTAVGIVYLAGLVQYLDGGGNIEVGTRLVSSTLGAAHNWISLTTAGFWDQATSQIAPLVGISTGTEALSDLDAQDVTLFDDTANPTLGDGTLLVTVSYFLAPTV